MDVEKVFSTLGNRHRLKILENISRLENEGVIVSLMMEFLTMKQPSITHHLTKMLESNVLTMAKDGHYHIYMINVKTLKVAVNFLNGLIEKCNKGNKNETNGH